MSVRMRLVGKISNGFCEKRKESAWRDRGRVPTDTADRSSEGNTCTCERERKREEKVHVGDL